MMNETVVLLLEEPQRHIDAKNKKAQHQILVALLQNLNCDISRQMTEMSRTKKTKQKKSMG